MNKLVVSAVAVASAGLLMTSFAVQSSAAKPAPKHRPSPVASKDRACTLSPSLNHSGGDFASCISVGARLSSVPSVGHTAKLTVTVKAARSERHTHVTVKLPPTFAFAGRTATRAAFTGAGRVSVATIATTKLAAGQTRTFTRIVKAIKTGFGEIAASAANRISSHRTDGGTDSVFTTVSSSGAQSHFGLPRAHPAATVGKVVHTHGTVAGPQRVSSHATALPALHRPATQVGIQPNTAGTSCATGTWNYVDQSNATRPAHNVVVNILRSGSIVASGYTSTGNGSYNLCWSTGGATQNVQVQFVESNIVWTLVDLSNNTYRFATGVTTINDGQTFNFGNLQPADSTLMRGLHAYDEANDEYQWIYGFFPYVGGCWSPFQTTCHQMVIHWQSNSTTGTFWNTSGAYLLAGSPDTLDEPVHEYGHGLMYNLYGQNFPATTNCSPHDLFVVSSTTCAWTEGWADWVATSVYNNMVWTYNGGFQRNMNVTWNEGLGYGTGDQVEARVVQAMRSITDGIKGPWDNDPGEGSGIRDNSRWFHVMADFRPNTFSAVWGDRALLGYDVSQTALSALYEGTIDYGFRNPLASGVGVHFPEAIPDHNYSMAASNGFWSLAAVRPDTATDVDLRVYNDFNHTSFLNSSSFSGTETDFVAINANGGHLSGGTYYPVAHQFAGSGGYTIEAISGSRVLSAGTSTTAFTGTQPATIYDSFQNPGTPLYIRAVPGSASQDLQVFVTSAGDNSTSRAGSTESDDPGAGNAATLVYNPTVSGWYGLVVTNNSLSNGTATIYADTSAPTGSVTINGGAATTFTRNVTLTLSANDPQTNVDAMQISTDGVFDTEPVVGYTGTASATLSAPNGTKTVYVRFRNNAGMWSAPVTDTITLDALNLFSVNPNAGRLAGGNTVTITGEGFAGATSVHFGSTAATSFTVVNSGKITAVAPAHAAGVVDVRVTGAQGTSPIVSADRYSYLAAPTVTKVSPISGPLGGGNTVTITGTGFTTASAVKFGSTAATSFTIVNSGKITAVAPAHAAGLVQVRVTGTGGTSAVSTGSGYTYQVAPTITAVSPKSGPRAGGTTVTITGTHFLGATAVKFGTTAATNVHVVSATKITARAPAHAAGVINIRVTTPSGTSAVVVADRYKFI